MNDKSTKILQTLKTKSLTKQKVFEIMKNTFEKFTETLHERSKVFNEKLIKADKRLLLKVTERSEFETELKVAGDVLIFQMHTNVFQFYRSHHVWQTSYLKDNELVSYVGLINVYNFLADSFAYNRIEDLGYLIARVFVNSEKHFFVEGKRQLGMMYNNFGQSILNDDSIREIVDTAILYALEFDLLVPLYDEMKIISVSQIQTGLQNVKLKTGKRLGFQFHADDATT